MKKTSICILWLMMGLKIQAMTLYSTMDTNSTEGNYYGALYFSFSSTNSNDYQYYGGGYGDQWFSISDNQTFTDVVSGVQIELNFFAGGEEAPGELNLLSDIYANDPILGDFTGNLGGHDESGGDFHVGQPKNLNYKSGEAGTYYSFTLSTVGTYNFGYSLPVSFDGTSGSGVGSWYVTYTVPSLTPTPEPAVTLELALGGFCLGLARAWQRRKK